MKETIIPKGLCQCGCGKPTKIARDNDASGYYLKGEPRRFIIGHNGRGVPSKNLKGKSYVTSKGYVMAYVPDHPRANNGGYVLEHIIISEKALGKFLPTTAQVHHFDENNANNQNNNLVICEGQKYHRLLHIRQRAQRATGNPNFRKCAYCKIWGDPRNDNMYVSQKTERAVHRKCDTLRALKYAKDNPEKVNKAHREWAARNSDKIKIYGERRNKRTLA